MPLLKARIQQRSSHPLVRAFGVLLALWAVSKPYSWIWSAKVNYLLTVALQGITLISMYSLWVSLWWNNPERISPQVILVNINFWNVLWITCPRFYQTGIGVPFRNHPKSLIILSTLSEHCLDFKLSRKGAVKLQCTRITNTVWRIRTTSVTAIELAGRWALEDTPQTQNEIIIFLPNPNTSFRRQSIYNQAVWILFLWSTISDFRLKQAQKETIIA